MSDFRLNGTRGIRDFMRANGIDENLTPRIASAVNVPQIHFGGRDGGQTAASFTRRITQAQAESLADLLGTSVANLQTQTILTVLP